MTKEEKIISQYQEKWSKLGLTSGDTNSNWFDNYQNHHFSTSIDTALTTNNQSFDSISFPIARRVMATTLGGGGWTKSEKQKLKENRLNKLRQLIGKKPNISLPDDLYIDGLVSVKPMSSPICNLLYMDYNYVTVETSEMKRIRQQKERRKKLENLNNIIRKDKLKYIEELL